MSKRILVLVVLLGISLLATSCNRDEEVPPVKEVVVRSIGFKDNVSTFNFQLETFKLEDIIIEIRYSNNTSDYIPVTKDMLNEDVFRALFTTGTYFFNVYYRDVVLEGTIRMTSNDGKQHSLPQVVLYSLMRVEGSKTIYDIYSIGNFVSYQLALNHNYEDDDFKIEGKFGAFSVTKNDEQINIIHSFGKNILGSNHLFSLVFENEEDCIDENIVLTYDGKNSIFYGFNNQIYEINGVKFYNR